MPTGDQYFTTCGVCGCWPCQCGVTAPMEPVVVRYVQLPDDGGTVPYGWVCPQCGQAYAPWKDRCDNPYCGVRTFTTTTLTVDAETVNAPFGSNRLEEEDPGDGPQ